MAQSNSNVESESDHKRMLSVDYLHVVRMSIIQSSHFKANLSIQHDKRSALESAMQSTRVEPLFYGLSLLAFQLHH
jgi:hypothetical protein